MEALPSGPLLLILGYLEIPEVANFDSTCRYWRDACHKEYFGNDHHHHHNHHRRGAITRKAWQDSSSFSARERVLMWHYMNRRSEQYERQALQHLHPNASLMPPDIVLDDDEQDERDNPRGRGQQEESSNEQDDDDDDNDDILLEPTTATKFNHATALFVRLSCIPPYHHYHNLQQQQRHRLLLSDFVPCIAAQNRSLTLSLEDIAETIDWNQLLSVLHPAGCGDDGKDMNRYYHTDEETSQSSSSSVQGDDDNNYNRKMRCEGLIRQAYQNLHVTVLALTARPPSLARRQRRRHGGHQFYHHHDVDLVCFGTMPQRSRPNIRLLGGSNSSSSSSTLQSTTATAGITTISSAEFNLRDIALDHTFRLSMYRETQITTSPFDLVDLPSYDATLKKGQVAIPGICRIQVSDVVDEDFSREQLQQIVMWTVDDHAAGNDDDDEFIQQFQAHWDRQVSVVQRPQRNQHSSSSVQSRARRRRGGQRLRR